MEPELREHLQNIEEALVGLQENKKDFWDRASVITTFLSGVVIAGLVAWWTMEAGKSELQLKEIELELTRLHQKTEEIDRTERRQLYSLEVVERFVPYVADNPERRKVALIALSELGRSEIATKFSQLYPDENTKVAVDQIQSQAVAETQDFIPSAVMTKPVDASSGGDLTSGWVYLGHYEDDTWKTRYLDFSGRLAPENLGNRTLNVRRETGALNVRNGPPGFFGRTKM